MPVMSDKPPQLSIWARIRYQWRKLVKPISKERRAEVRITLREDSRPDFDYFLLVVLSSIIATQGLLVNSPAIIIGAMLVAPLMSPLIGLGLASIAGDDKLLRDSVSSVFRGALISILIAFAITWVNKNLPFVVLYELPSEVTARVVPSTIDLGVALAGGAAAAFALAMPNISAALPGVAIATAIMPPLCTIGIGLALGRWDVAGGAALLFITNAVAIVFATTLVFFSLGFRGPLTQSQNRVPRSLIVSAIITVILLGSLSYLSYQVFQSATENRIIENVVVEEVAKLEGVELVEWSSEEKNGTLNLDLIVRTPHLLRYEDSVKLQYAIAERLGRPVAILISQILAAQLDPLVLPTPSATATATRTFTPGPSPTLTATATRTPTVTATATSTYTSTPTATEKPTSTYTPTPALAQAARTGVPGLSLRQEPGGPEIAQVRPGQPFIVLYGEEIRDGIVWVKVRDQEGRIGWIPQIYLVKVTYTPTSTVEASGTVTPISP
jgi:uncharacterized hydrophobic protein (TIGR00271 family)